MKRFVLCLAGLLLVFCAVAQVEAGLFAVDGAGGNVAILYELDPTTGGVLSTIGATGFSHVTGIAFHPTTGILYGVVSNSGQLITINTTTGAGTLVGTTGEQIPDIDFNSAGTLYGWSERDAAFTRSDDLVTLDLTTGASTLVGLSNFGTSGTGLAFDSSDSLYVKRSNTLHSVDATTGLSTGSIGITGTGVGSLDNILAFDNSNVMYSADRTGGGATLYTVDPTTGVATLVGSNSIDNLSALAFSPAATPIPEPSTLLLFGVGLLGVIGIGLRRQRRAA